MCIREHKMCASTYIRMHTYSFRTAPGLQAEELDFTKTATRVRCWLGRYLANLKALKLGGLVRCRHAVDAFLVRFCVSCFDFSVQGGGEPGVQESFEQRKDLGFR